MFNKHVTLALAVISTEAINLRLQEDYPIMGANGAGLAPQEELAITLELPPVRTKLPPMLRPMPKPMLRPIMGADGAGLAPKEELQELSVEIGELAQAERVYPCGEFMCIYAQTEQIDPADWGLGFAETEADAQAELEHPCFLP